jgi:carboxypeptidase Q
VVSVARLFHSIRFEALFWIISKHQMFKIYTLIGFCLVLNPNILSSQTDNDVFMVKRIHDEILENSTCYTYLQTLCTDHPARLGGSKNYVNAAEYSQKFLSKIDGVRSSLQLCEAQYWERGDKCDAYIQDEKGQLSPLNVLALGNSEGTKEEGILAEVVEVKSLEEVEKLGTDNISGRIVFFNRAMDKTKIKTFAAYGGAVDQRGFGAAKAAKFGAAAVLVRSMTTADDDFPHTGVTIYNDTLPKIPALAISTNDANKLSKMLSSGTVNLYLNSNSKLSVAKSAPNVIGEIKGSMYPDEIILVGGHLDSWDVSQGAHDDGTGCAQAIEVLRTLVSIGYVPKRTIRCVLFSNEENGLAGAKTYAEISNKKKEFHLAALESDSGGFSPRGFSVDADSVVIRKYLRQLAIWSPILEPYGLMVEKGGSGADINPLKSQKGLLMGLRTDSARYFDYHHSAQDNLNTVNKRELELGAAAMTSIVYLIDQHGLK